MSLGACFPILRNITIGTNSIEQVTYYCQCYSGFTGFNCQDSNYFSHKNFYIKDYLFVPHI